MFIYYHIKHHDTALNGASVDPSPHKFARRSCWYCYDREVNSSQWREIYGFHGDDSSSPTLLHGVTTQKTKTGN